MAELAFEVKYRKCKINVQADSLSRLHKTGKIVPHNDNDDIAVYELDMVRVELGAGRDPKEAAFIDTRHAVMEERYAAVDDPEPTIFNVEPIGVEEFL